jgi:ABC-type multidrug transport system fused ATPase/permease subunit
MGQKIIQQTLWQKIKRFYEPALLRKKEHIKYIFQQIIISLSSLLWVIFLERIISALSLWDSQGFFLALVLYAFLLVFFEITILLTRKWWWMNTLPYNIVDIYKKYLGKYLKMDNNVIELLGTWKTIWIVNEWAKVWANLIADSVIKITQLIVTIWFTLFMISRVSYIYVLVFIVLMIVAFAFIIYINKLQTVFRARRYEYRNIRMKQFVKVVMSRMEVLQAWKFSWEIQEMYINTHKISWISIEMATYRILLNRSASFLISFVLILLFFVMGKDILSWEISVSLLVGISGTLIVMQRSITDAMGFYINFLKDFISVEKLWEFYDTTPEIQGYEEWKKFKHVSWAISLKNINYWYDPSKSIFQNFNLDIPGNKITALVGPSGGGKSTLVKLISGYVRQDSWDILVDDQNLKETSLKSYYSDVGYLTQEPSVFDGTVRENLMYAVTEPHLNSSPQGEDEATEEMQPLSPWGERIQDRGFESRLQKIISLAHCEFIYNLPNWLDTEIWERGVRLSWGQKQRLAIAKIFLKDPKIIILDEPTSALDSLSEQKITQAMHNLFNGRTVIVIAHRLQTVKHADDIIVIEWWEIKERGTHASLVRKKWFYKQMLDLQSGF